MGEQDVLDNITGVLCDFHAEQMTLPATRDWIMALLVAAQCDALERAAVVAAGLDACAIEGCNALGIADAIRALKPSP